LAVGSYNVTGTTSDPYGDTGTFSFTLSVTAGSLSTTPTLAIATVATSATYSTTLATTNNTGTVTYVQTTGTPSLVVSSSGVVTTSGTLAVGSYQATGTTSDLNGDTGSFSFTLIVGSATLATTPTTDSATVPNSSSYTTTLSTSGNFGGSVTYTKTSGSASVLVSSSGLITTSGTLAVGSYNVTGTTSDPDGDVGTFSFTLSVTAGTLTTTPTSGNAPAGSLAGFSGSLTTSGNFGGAVTYIQTSGTDVLVSSSGVLSLSNSSLSVGTYVASGTTSDPDGDHGSFTYTFYVTGGGLTTIPTSGSVLATGSSGFSDTLSTLNNTGPVTYNQTSGTSVVVSSAGSVTTSGSLVAGTYTATGTTSDTNGDIGTFTYTLTVFSAPTLVGGTLPTGIVGVNYSETITSGGTDSPFTWSASNLPPGITINPSTGTLSGVPTASGLYAISITVYGAHGESSSATYSMATFNDPRITTTSLPPIPSNGTAYGQSLTATGGTMPYSWAITGGSLPAGLTLNTATGQISGVATTPGSASITVTLTDASHLTSTQTLNWLVATPPSITTTNLPQGTQGNTYNYQVAGSGTGTPYTWGLAPGSALPAGLSLNASTGVISGLPTTAGSTAVTLLLVDSAGQSATSAPLTLVINGQSPPPPPSGPTISNTTLPNATTGTSYGDPMYATGGAAPYYWTATGLPPGLQMSPTTGISGTATTPGTYTVTVTVSDANNNQVSKVYSLVVLPAMSVTPTSLPNATQGVNYNEVLTGSGSQGTVTWFVTGLPAGMSLSSSGVISGAPTQTGSFTVMVTMSSSSGQVTRTYTLIVNGDALNISTPSLAKTTVTFPYSQQVTGSGTVAPLSWSASGLPAGLTINHSTGLISGAAILAGNYNVAVVLTDASGQTLTKYFPLTVAAQPVQPPASIAQVVGFASGSSAMTPLILKQIMSAATFIKKHGDHHVMLTGYTDSTGSKALNLALGKARSFAVGAQLKKDLAKLKYKGLTYSYATKGSKNQVTKNPRQLILNRRVQITVGA
jgi:outer membrane protein OmpA-like peptidoglycan-associated protein